MEVVIVVAIGIALWGAITIAWVLSSQGAPRAAAPEAPTDASTEAPHDAIEDAPPSDWAAEAMAAAIEPEPARPDSRAAEAAPEPGMPVYTGSRRDEVVMPVNALQLNAIEIIAGQVERLQADYIRLETERERLAQELLTSYLIEKIEGSAGRLKAETRKEAQDLRTQLVKVSAEFERAQFRLASLEHLQARLDDPRVARQIDELVRTVRHLAGER
jgi:hypothetical protein